MAVHDLGPIQILAAMRDDPPTNDPHSEVPIGVVWRRARSRSGSGDLAQLANLSFLL